MGVFHILDPKEKENGRPVRNAFKHELKAGHWVI
jgi:hypothetical protein